MMKLQNNNGVRIAIVLALAFSRFILQFSVVECFVPNKISSFGKVTLETDASYKNLLDQVCVITGENSATALYGKRRMSKRGNKVGKSRPEGFTDQVGKTAKEGEAEKKSDEGVLSAPSVTDAQPSKKAKDDRPEVTTIIVDEETGIERIAQGKAVMDVVTRKAVKLSDMGSEYRLAQMFPGVPPQIRAEHRVTKDMSVPEIVQRLKNACIDPNTGELPVHPQVTNTGIDFVLANRDLLSSNMKKTLGRLKLRSQSLNQLDEAREYRKLWKHFLTLEDSISAPFRQVMLDAESRVGPNFGNLDLRSYIGMELYERVATYLVLKGMVCHWEKKFRDAEYVEKTAPELQQSGQKKVNYITVLSTGDPKRYLPDPPIIFKYDEVARVTLMAQQMTATFVNDTALFGDLPVEVRFIEYALSIKGGSALRKFVIDDFCPAEGITPEGLMEGLLRLDAQLENMQIDPYGDLKNTVGKLAEALAVGTPDEFKNPYKDYVLNLDSNGPGYFQTYTFNHDRNSLVRFLDSAKKIEQGSIGNSNDVLSQLSGEAKMMMGLNQPVMEDANKGLSTQKEADYVVPQKRALGRPHNLGWLDWLEEDREEEPTFESDNWREIKSS